jgi:hypothetical protein
MKFLKTVVLSLVMTFLLLLIGTNTASAAAMTDFAENKVLDATLRAQAIGTPATWYIALYTACPTDSTAGTEVTGGSYARVAVTAGLTQWAGSQAAASTTASSGTGGTTSNNATITFPAPTAPWGVVTCWGLTDAPSAGNIWIYSALTTNKTINNGDAAPSFAAAAATFQIDN